MFTRSFSTFYYYFIWTYSYLHSRFYELLCCCPHGRTDLHWKANFDQWAEESFCQYMHGHRMLFYLCSRGSCSLDITWNIVWEEVNNVYFWTKWPLEHIGLSLPSLSDKYIKARRPLTTHTICFLLSVYVLLLLWDLRKQQTKFYRIWPLWMRLILPH